MSKRGGVSSLPKSGTNQSALTDAPAWPLSEVNFLGCAFAHFTRKNEILDFIKECAHAPFFSYIVTPNVDNIIRISKIDASDMREIYDAAIIRICDSRVLGFLAWIFGISLPVYPGSDITQEILERNCLSDLKLGIVGPSEEDFRILSQFYPHIKLKHINSPSKMSISSIDFQACVDLTLNSDWDLLFVCLGSPKQECFISTLRKRGRSRGTAIAAGASVDFLTGRQTRAPAAMQRMGLEWLYRLATSPRRLGKRYLIGAPAIIFLLWQREIFRRDQSPAVDERVTQSRPHVPEGSG